MPSEALSPRKRTRVASLCLVLLCPLACASNARPVEVRDGGLRAGIFEVGHFYRLDDANQWQHVQVPAPSSAVR